MSRPLQHLSNRTLLVVFNRNPTGKLPMLAEQELDRELALRGFSTDRRRTA